MPLIAQPMSFRDPQGMLLTTAGAFAPGDLLTIVARLPYLDVPQIVQGTAAAVESREIVPSLLYDARVRFVDLDGRSCQIVGAFCEGDGDQFAAKRCPRMAG